MKVIANTTLRLSNAKGRRHVEPGTEVDLTDADAAALMASGHVRDIAGKAASPTTPPSLEDIADAIDQLDAQKDFKDGVPVLKSLERILKAPITAAQRDEAWAKVQADKKAAAQ